MRRRGRQQYRVRTTLPATRLVHARASVRVCLALLALALAACGGRTGPLEDETVGETDAEGGAPPGHHPTTIGACVLCDDQVQCSHCYVQAYLDTFRCPPLVLAPDDACWSLDERHVDQYGFAYTCFYCP